MEDSGHDGPTAQRHSRPTAQRANGTAGRERGSRERRNGREAGEAGRARGSRGETEEHGDDVESGAVSDQQRALNDLERELTLLARHYVSARKPRDGQTLDRSAYVLLTRLEADEPLTLKQLAETFRVDVSTINRQVAAMLRNGLVERIPDPEGGMARKFRPTPHGLERLAADRDHSRAGTRRVVADWPEDHVEELVALLSRFNRSVENLEGVSWPRPADGRPSGGGSGGRATGQEGG
ncbi:winged helix-turn-helix transcriptional regulator [Streptomyces cacaoi]|nr:winged helix-turn-helix transcriptional regulator [Streptomyces cacaoi]